MSKFLNFWSFKVFSSYKKYYKVNCVGDTMDQEENCIYDPKLTNDPLLVIVLGISNEGNFNQKIDYSILQFMSDVGGMVITLYKLFFFIVKILTYTKVEARLVHIYLTRQNLRDEI